VHVAKQVDDQTLVGELAWQGVGVHLQNTLHAIRHVEERDDFDGSYPEEVVEGFGSAMQMLTSTGDPNLTEAFRNGLAVTGSDLAE
jgi:hypothetical protein